MVEPRVARGARPIRVSTAARSVDGQVELGESGSPPRRVIAITGAGGMTGPARQLAALAAAARNHGVDFRVLLLIRSGMPASVFAEHLAALDVPFRYIDDDGPLDRALPGRMRRALDELRPDVVQTHGYKATAVMWWLRRAPAPWAWVGCFHGTTHETLRARLYHRLDHAMLRRADVVIAMSRLQADALERLGARVRVVHNAVVPLAAPAGAAERTGLEAGIARLPRPRAAVIGRLSPEKGVDVLLAACAELRSHDAPPFSMLVVGDGPEREALHAQARALGIADTVSFLGDVRAMDVVYANADLVVIPSRSEGLPNVLLEALAADIPIVATRVGAVPDVLVEPAAGRLVPPASASALATAIRDALASLDDTEARAARQRAAQRFSLVHRVEAHLRIYREAIALHGAVPS